MEDKSLTRTKRLTAVEEDQARSGGYADKSDALKAVPYAGVEGGTTTCVPRVLVVDDDPDVVAICSMILESEGYEVQAAGNGYDAVDRVSNADVDVLLLDVMMPVLDGLTVCKMIKRDPKTHHVPVIIMSASQVLRDKSKACDADAVIAKPFDIEHLVDTVSQFAPGI